MTVTVTNIIPGTTGLHTTYMYSKRPRGVRRLDSLRRAMIPVLGVLLATTLILWFTLGAPD